jgi:hypothetical protein
MKTFALVFLIFISSLAVADSSPKISICNSNGYEYPIYREEPKHAVCYFPFFGTTAYGVITKVVNSDKVTICRTPNTRCVGRRTKENADRCGCMTPIGMDTGHYVEIVE